MDALTLAGAIRMGLPDATLKTRPAPGLGGSLALARSLNSVGRRVPGGGPFRMAVAAAGLSGGVLIAGSKAPVALTSPAKSVASGAPDIRISMAPASVVSDGASPVVGAALKQVGQYLAPATNSLSPGNGQGSSCCCKPCCPPSGNGGGTTPSQSGSNLADTIGGGNLTQTQMGLGVRNPPPIYSGGQPQNYPPGTI